MRAFAITPPTPIVAWEEADAHLRLDGDTSQRPYVESLIAAAQGHIDGPDGWLGRAIGKQTIEARFDNFDSGSIRLPYPPVLSVTSVSYVDANGIAQVIDADHYETFGASLVPVFGASWPTPRWARETVRIRYWAGYETVPPAIKAAVLLMVDDLYRSRGNVAIGVAATAVPMPTAAENLLNLYRVFA